MRSDELKKDAIRKLAVQFQGMDARSPRVLGSQIFAAGNEAALLALPVDVDEWQAGQDPATGALYFIPGLSDPNGDDVLV